jgi:hypothetical protein
MNGFSNDEADSIMAQIRDAQSRQATDLAITRIFGGTNAGAE